MDAAWTAHKRQLSAAVRQATRQLLDIVRANPHMSQEDLLFYYQALIDQYGQAAAESALLALENSRRTVDLWNKLAAPVRADLPATGQVKGTLAWAVNKAGGKDLTAIAIALVGPLGRLIQQPARDTIWNSTRAAGTRYARVPGPKACWFCLMLASRGGVYTSKESALSVSSRSATRPTSHWRNPSADAGHSYQLGRPRDAAYHDNCTCIAVESHSPDDLPDVVRTLQEEWYDVTWTDRGPAPGQAELWKKHIRETRPNGETLRPD
ncbi:hypothetical protein [uncultured Corynebacterium sp.]|uniref:VG15 protein n=1 Tax=uncultured Corynebacterium sp. TaxID=159447 RepID=UPI0025DA9D43|nr:hypothetical protein [uncultured Corynebacterium sp.]